MQTLRHPTRYSASVRPAIMAANTCRPIDKSQGNTLHIAHGHSDNRRHAQLCPSRFAIHRGPTVVRQRPRCNAGAAAQ